MTKSERFKPLVRMAESKELDAAKELGDCARILKEKQAGLDELRHYRQEYAQRFQQDGAAGISARKVRDYQAFLATLDRGIEEQRKVVDQAARNLEEKKQQWSTKRTRTKALDNAVARFKDDERQTQARREQKESDERAIQNYGDPKKS
jgi:flagellar FliJ protein